MGHNRLFLVLGLALAALAGSARAGTLVGVEAKFWHPEVDAEVKASTAAIEGTEIDMEDDLDLDSADSVPYLKVWVGGSQRLVGSITRLKLEGDEAPTVNIQFEGETYQIGIEVESILETTIYRVAWEGDWIDTDTVRLGTILGVDIFDTKASIENAVVGKEEFDEDIPIPVIGLQGEVRLPHGFGAYGEIAGLYIESGDDTGSFVEFEVGAKYTYRWFSAMAGWRQIDIDIEVEEGSEEDEAHLGIGGFIVGVSAAF